MSEPIELLFEIVFEKKKLKSSTTSTIVTILMIIIINFYTVFKVDINHHL